MPVTKITLSVAMRARDVSRPRAEDYAEAAGGEEAPLNPLNPRGSAAAEPVHAEPVHAEPAHTVQVAEAGESPPSRRRRRRTRSGE